jgi:hypothetical protein
LHRQARLCTCLVDMSVARGSPEGRLATRLPIELSWMSSWPQSKPSPSPPSRSLACVTWAAHVVRHDDATHPRRPVWLLTVALVLSTLRVLTSDSGRPTTQPCCCRGSTSLAGWHARRGDRPPSGVHSSPTTSRYRLTPFAASPLTARRCGGHNHAAPGYSQPNVRVVQGCSGLYEAGRRPVALPLCGPSPPTLRRRTP